MYICTCCRSKQNQHGLRKGLEIVIAIYRRVVVYRDLSEDLKRSARSNHRRYVLQTCVFFIDQLTCMPITA